jgi:periplasmic protein CpxP/Spy
MWKRAGSSIIDMKHLKLALLIFAAMTAGSITGYAQDGPPHGEGPRDERAGNRRPDLFAELGLSREQHQQLRRMNQERRPQMMEAQRRLREANQNLDIAIYADTLSEGDFQTRLAEFRTAQSTVSRLRFENELAVRKILTPEQLVKFRELRRRFAEEREGEIRERRQRRRMDRHNGPPVRGIGPVQPPPKDQH